MGNQWLFDHLPAALSRSGPFELLWWQWLALPVLILVAWGIGFLLGMITRKLLLRFAAHTATEWDDAILARIGAPLTASWMLATLYFLVLILGLQPLAEAFVQRRLYSGFLIIIFWALWRTIDVMKPIVLSSSWAKASAASHALVPLASRMTKVLIFGIATVTVLSQLGYPMMSLLAGLGIGGLAFALAAQKTVENLFGAFSLGVDQPFREGDFVKIEDFTGTVESIGLRSTRIRTLDRTLISMPNGKLAEMRVESYAARDRIRLNCTIGLVYETTAAQMLTVLAGLERTLQEHPKIWPDAMTVCFKELGDSSLNIDVMAWFQTSDWPEFMQIRQEVLLEFMNVVEKAGTSFALPTRTVHLARATLP